MWVIGSVAALVGLAAVVVAFLSDRPVDEERPSRLGPGLPRPGELRSLRFPTTFWGGYDHREVDTDLADLAERYEALYLAAGPSVIAEAERRLSGRTPDADATSAASAEELEDGGRDGTRVLDR
ncbi:MAG: DivIVA domain-containing protein [Actinobacteria bacterium]|nr:DivIVA domain-containing protein [Actinomycetota bacterium]